MEEKDKNLTEEENTGPEKMPEISDDSEDDGRTIADMSVLYDAFPRRFKRKKTSAENTEERNSDSFLTKDEKKWYILGALKATMLIFLAFAAGFAVVILLIILIYNLFN